MAAMAIKLLAAATLPLAASFAPGAVPHRASPWLGRASVGPAGAATNGGHRVARFVAAAEATTTAVHAAAEATEVYSQPELYDLAFSYRDFEDEVDFLFAAHAKHGSSGAPPASVLELAAGPARHCLIAAQEHGVRVAALDNSQEMVAYGSALASEMASEAAAALRYVQADMASFALPDDVDTVDTAWLLLGSAGHLLTGRDFLGMLESVGKSLNEGGTLILELPHPRETFRLYDVTAEGWNVPEGDDNGLGIGLSGEEGGGFLEVTWGADEDEFDPVSQVRQATVELELEREGVIVQRVRQSLPQREFTPQELIAYAIASGVFEEPTFYGALDLAVGVDDEEEAYRLVAVLRRS